MKDKIECQEKILHLMINNPELVNVFVVNKLEPESFDPKYRPLLHAIYHAHTRSSRLTHDGFVDFVIRTVADGSYSQWIGATVSGPKAAELAERANFLNLCNLVRANKDDFELYLRSFKEMKAREDTNKLFEGYQLKMKSGEFFAAVAGLSEGLQRINSAASESKAQTLFIDEESPEYLKMIRQLRTNPQERLLTGISDLDDSMTVGLYPGSLTLFVADVGGYKSTTMLNVALNVYKRSKKNVLFVSLEMPKEMVLNKIISRETGVKFEKLIRPDMLSDAELAKAEEETIKWQSNDHKFAILDGSKDRFNVADLRAEIERHISFFKPDVVIIDYISILAPEKWYSRQQPHEWIGHMCKSLRQLGSRYRFAVISASQLGREAIKRLKSQKDGSQTVGSEDLRGSHEFSADSDNIYALVPHPNQPGSKLLLFCIKARYGRKTFNGATRAMLDIRPEIGLVTGATDATWGHEEGTKDPAIKHVEQMDAVMDFENDLDLDGGSPKQTTSVKTEPIPEPPKPVQKKSSGRVALDVEL